MPVKAASLGYNPQPDEPPHPLSRAGLHGPGSARCGRPAPARTAPEPARRPLRRSRLRPERGGHRPARRAADLHPQLHRPGTALPLSGGRHGPRAGQHAVCPAIDLGLRGLADHRRHLLARPRDAGRPAHCPAGGGVAGRQLLACPLQPAGFPGHQPALVAGAGRGGALSRAARRPLAVVGFGRTADRPLGLYLSGRAAFPHPAGLRPAAAAP